MNSRTATNFLLAVIAGLMALSLFTDSHATTDLDNPDEGYTSRLIEYEKCLDLVKGVSKGIGGEYNFVERMEYQKSICQKFRP